MSEFKKIIKNLESLNSKKNFSAILTLVENLEKNIQELPQILIFSGWANLNLNKIEEAIDLFEQGLQQDPNNPDLLTNCGKAYYAKKDFNKSISLLEQSLNVNSNNVDTIIHLSRALFESGKLKNSFKLLEIAINANLKNPHYYFEISNNFFKIKDYNLAIKFYKKTIELNPKFPNAHLNLGINYQLINEHKQAIHCLAEEAKINPGNHLIYFNLGNIYRETGNLEKSYENYRKSIELNYYHAESYRNLTSLKKFNLNDDLVKKLEDVFSEYERNKDTQSLMSASYALSKIYEDSKDYHNSFKHFTRGNSLRREQIRYSTDNTKKQFKMIKELFSREFFQQLPKSNNLSNKAIFVLGMPRSGTTMTEQIVSRHPEVSSGGELTYLQSIIKKKFPINDYDLFLQDVLKKLKNEVTNIADEYCAFLKNIDPNTRVVDKLPFNFIFIGFIKACLPNSKIIHCVRNSKDTCISILKNYFPLDDVGFAHNEREIVEYYDEYANLMQHWKGIFGEGIYDLQYEQIVTNQDLEIKKLLKYLDLDWSEACLNDKNNNNAIKTISTVQARQPIYTTSVNSWERYSNFLSKEFLSLP